MTHVIGICGVSWCPLNGWVFLSKDAPEKVLCPEKPSLRGQQVKHQRVQKRWVTWLWLHDGLFVGEVPRLYPRILTQLCPRTLSRLCPRPFEWFAAPPHPFVLSILKSVLLLTCTLSAPSLFLINIHPLLLRNQPRRNRCVFSCKMRLGFLFPVNLYVTPAGRGEIIVFSRVKCTWPSSWL